ncbi:MAG: hypothetical protein M1549_00040 [Candidatus Dependentiae bacterium]|nr:hypothetical protein [Candidatus Dependentiae bacterium]
MSPYQRFVALVQYDQRVLAQQKRVAQIDEQIAGLDRDIAAVRARHEQSLSALRELRKTRDRLELDAKTLSTERAQKRKKLENTADVKAYSALEHELGALAEREAALEESILSVWQELEEQERQIPQLDAAIAAELHVFEDRRTALLQEREGAVGLLQELASDREKMLVGVPAEWLTTYDAMRVQCANPVVPMRDHVCAGCGFPVPSGGWGAIAHHVLVTCQQCRRLLVDSRVFDEVAAGETHETA